MTAVTPESSVRKSGYCRFGGVMCILPPGRGLAVVTTGVHNGPMPVMARRLSTQIFTAQLIILFATVVVGFALFARQARSTLDHQYQQRSVAIASTVAGMTDVRECLSKSAACTEPLQDLADRVQSETGATYVVIFNRHDIRMTHPNPDLVGVKNDEPLAVLDGQTHMGTDQGTLGRSANGKAPIWGAHGALMGEVSVGVKETTVADALRQQLPSYAAWFLLALGGGAIASWLLARRLKKRTFGLELDEIALLLREREATLHGIREGVISCDPDDRITMVNDEARRLLGLGVAPIGGRLGDVLPEGRLLDLLAGSETAHDEVVLTDDFALLVNKMPVFLAGRPHGTAVTLRDRTEIAGLLRELDGVRRLTDTLRAQHHEFTNTMHTVAGLIELGEHEDALAFLTDVQTDQAAFSDAVRERISAAPIVGLLLGKAAAASERGVDLRLSEDSWLGDTPEKVHAMTTIIGNLIDNALDAVSPHRGRIEVEICEDEQEILIEVADNGPGVPEELRDQIFLDGFTTKPAHDGIRRGIGLALVHRLVQRLGGSIEVAGTPGARFVIRLPVGAAHRTQREVQRA
jgi:two-component system, CitB family, sensor kinase